MTKPDPSRRVRGLYVAGMTRVLAVAALFSLAAAIGTAGAQDATTSALRDAARAQERQAETMRQVERVQADRARDLDRARRNAERDSRSARRFD